ncbi:MAG: MFS transporter [Deltaproteobacteria bacterium]|nr:MFS transporter [Deltaproteobacteria bacterium]
MPDSSVPPSPAQARWDWPLITVAFLLLFVGSGVRTSIGLLIVPLIQEFAWSRGALSAAISLQLLLYSVGHPLAGMTYDRYPLKPLVLVGLGLCALAFFLAAGMQSLWQAYLLLGVMLGIGLVGPSPLTSSTLVLRGLPARRDLALSLSGTGVNSVGMAALVVAVLRGARSARVAAVGPAGGPEPHAAPGEGGADVGMSQAVRHLPFWLMAVPYFFCGFADNVILVHLPLLARDQGLPPMVAGAAVGLLGGASILGTLAMGPLAYVASKKDLLAGTYLLRVVAFFLLPFMAGATGVYLFAGLFGVTYFITSPLVASLTVDLYGSGSLGSMFGWLNLAHFLGGALGPAAGALLYQLQGSYVGTLLLCAALSFVAATVSALIRRPPPSISSAPS